VWPNLRRLTSRDREFGPIERAEPPELRSRMAVACPPRARRYEPRDPTQSVLLHVVRDHFETFRAQAAALRDGEGLPGFVEREFREFLTCGCLAAGFAGSSATAAGTIGWCRSRAKGAASVRVVVDGEWRSVRRTWSTTCCPTFRCDSGC
jgi:hypothetical protein